MSQHGDRPTLVLLPGLDGTGKLFAPLLEAMPREFDPIVVPYPTDVPLGYDDLTRRIAETLPTDRQLILLGESLGGRSEFSRSTLLRTRSPHAIELRNWRL